MVTVLEGRDEEGELIGRCDARCHTAKGTTCTCICGGTNHGLGAEHALNNDIFFMERAAQGLVFSRPVVQRKLFTREPDE